MSSSNAVNLLTEFSLTCFTPSLQSDVRQLVDAQFNLQSKVFCKDHHHDSTRLRQEDEEKEAEVQKQEQLAVGVWSEAARI